MDRLRAHHRRRGVRRALSATLLPIAAAAAFCAGCGRRADPPLPPPRLEERDARLDEVRARLTELDAPDGGVAAAVALTRHEDHRVRRAAALRLMGMGPRAADAIPELAALLDGDDEPRVRTAAARALGAIRDLRALEPLLSALADPDRAVRLWAWKALRELGDGALPALVAALVSDAPAMQREYRDEVGAKHSVRDELLERLPTVGKPVAAALVPVLGGDARGKATAIDLLRRLETQAREALPALAAVAEGELDGAATRIAALRAIEAIGDLDPSVLPAVNAAAASEDAKIAGQAKKTLAALKKAAAKPDPPKRKAPGGPRGAPPAPFAPPIAPIGD